jgi:hypothetical protein
MGEQHYKHLTRIGQLGRGQAGDKTPRATGTERAPAGSVQVHSCELLDGAACPLPNLSYFCEGLVMLTFVHLFRFL